MVTAEHLARRAYSLDELQSGGPLRGHWSAERQVVIEDPCRQPGEEGLGRHDSFLIPGVVHQKVGGVPPSHPKIV